MKKSIITEKPIYKVNLYYLLGKSYTFDNFCCVSESVVGEMTVFSGCPLYADGEEYTLIDYGREEVVYK